MIIGRAMTGLNVVSSTCGYTWLPDVRRSSAGPVNVGAVIDTYDVYGSGGFVNAVDHPVGAASCGVVPGQLACERLADPVRVVQQCSGQELSHRRGDRNWQTAGRSLG
jgi:hypothetical protein